MTFRARKCPLGFQKQNFTLTSFPPKLVIWEQILTGLSTFWTQKGLNRERFSAIRVSCDPGRWMLNRQIESKYMDSYHLWSKFTVDSVHAQWNKHVNGEFQGKTLKSCNGNISETINLIRSKFVDQAGTTVDFVGGLLLPTRNPTWRQDAILKNWHDVITLPWVVKIGV